MTWWEPEEENFAEFTFRLKKFLPALTLEYLNGLFR